ncbi:PKD domain-containing protein [Danxiaibacter flavus]|uniref:PKD domain-containing protein n=1 Tax=Danxiaibacter flavus TaxID=3049108 RepID=A0ABV3ZI92_9BACT|nr:PKD domain-containing protein [Chitinophagaceae bacterium DXS]
MHRNFTISMRTLFAMAIFLLSLANLNKADAQTNTPRTVSISSNIGGYWEYLPADYATSGKKYPVLFFFHGVGEQGDGSTSALQLVLKNGPPKLINNGTFPKTFTVNGKTFSFIVICPQMKNSQWIMSDYKALIAYMKSKYRIDTTRIYLSGLSMGGGNAMYYSSNDGNVSKTIAATVTASEASRPNSYTVRTLATANVPVWLCTNKIDPTVPPSYSISWHDSLAKYVPKMPTQPLLDVFDASGHDSWTQTFDPNFRPRGLNVYEWMLQYTRGTSTTAPTTPTTNVYPKITVPASVTLPVTSVTLDGTGSTTNNGATISSYLWKVVSGPSGYTLGSSTSSKATLSNVAAGTYSLQLTVTNNYGVTATASASLVVNAATQGPVAVINGASNITLPKDSVTLDGTKSTDASGTVTTYTWSCLSGPTGYTIVSPSSATTRVTKLSAGTYKFKLTIKDDKGATSADTAAFTVSNPTVTGPVIVFKAPSSVTTSSITLDASGSYTAAGRTITKYDWRYISGPKGATYTDSTKPVITVSNLKTGTYTYALKISDGTTSVSGTVSFAATVASTTVSAKISAPSSVVLPTSSVTLDGTGSTTSSGATITNYSWSVSSAPTGYTLVNSSSSKATLSNLAAGTYTVQLAVTNSSGVKASTTANIAVTNDDATGPVVVFKAPVTVSATSVILDASASYTVPGRTITKYDWRYIAGPKGAVYTDSTKPAITLSKLVAGTYTYQVKISDSKASATARIIFTVASSTARVAATDTAASSIASATVTSSSFATPGSVAESAKQQATLKLAPVPTRDNLQLMLNNSSSGRVSIRVTDMSGRTMLLKNAATKQFASWQDNINVAGFMSGVYFVEIFVGNEKFTGKFVKAGS